MYIIIHVTSKFPWENIMANIKMDILSLGTNTIFKEVVFATTIYHASILNPSVSINFTEKYDIFIILQKFAYWY